MGAFFWKGTRVRIISKSKLREFWEKHPETEEPLKEWFRVVSKANWKNFVDVRNTFRHADPYCDCVIFDVKGNDIRLIGIILYSAQRIYVRYVLNHAEYDKERWKNDCNC